MVSKYYAADASTGLIKRALGSAAVTADGYVGTQWDQGAAVITDAICRIIVEAINIADGDEVYEFVIVGSNVADRSDGQILAVGKLGDASAMTLQTVDSAAGDILDIRFRTERGDTAFRYVDLYLNVIGSSCSITYGAYFSVEVA